MPFDFMFALPPAGRLVPDPATLGEFDCRWGVQIASLIEAQRPSHVLVENTGLLFSIPRRLPAVVARKVAVCDRAEPYPEVFVFGSPAAFAAVVHETPEAAMAFDLSHAFGELRVADRAKDVPGSDAARYRCFEKKTAAKLARCFSEALAQAGGLSFEWVPPLKPISINKGDGGQDGLLRLAGQPTWLQVTGGEKPGILPSRKSPGPAAAYFFLAEGMSSSALKPKSSALRRPIYGEKTPDRADILHVAVGKAAPLASMASAIRGIAREPESKGGPAPLWLRTVTLHPIEVLDPFAGSENFALAAGSLTISAPPSLSSGAFDRP